MNPDQKSPSHALSGLRRKRAFAAAALWFEQAWPAVWPGLGVLAAYAVAALLGLLGAAPVWARLLLLVLVLALAGALLWRGARTLRAPAQSAADRRIEHASGLRHRPLSALQDRPANPTPEAAAVWQLHQTRLLGQISRLRVGRPRPGLAARDHWALRGLAIIGLAAAWTIAGPDAPARLWAAVAPGFPATPAGPATITQAWLTPPAYTGLPPAFLQSDAKAVSAPAGSRLTASVTGGAGAPSLSVPSAAGGSETIPFKTLDSGSWQAERDLAASGPLSISRGGVLASWSLAIIPDQPPSIAFSAAPGALADAGPIPRTRLPWAAADDYGVTAVQAELRLQDRPGAAPVTFETPLGGSPMQPTGSFAQDLTANPWAGLPVTARLIARDAAGQTGASADAVFTLPERAFENPAARAILAVRKQLTLVPEERGNAARALDVIAAHPALLDDSFGLVLNLRAIEALLLRGRGQAAVDDAQARMWTLALALEEGAAERAAQALERARQAMREAMDAARRDPADQQKQTELERRIEALREAIQKRLETLAEQAAREGMEVPPLDPNAPQLTARDLDRMAQEMQKAAREGRVDDAQRQMAEMERLLERLQNARPETAQERAQRNEGKRQQGQQQADALKDIVQREGKLLDRSQARDAAPAPEQPFSRSLPPSLDDQPPQRAEPDVSEQAARDREKKTQDALRRILGELMQHFGDLTGEVPKSLGEAELRMRGAGQALADGDDGQAAASQREAIEALQKGGREMAQALAEQFGPGEGSQSAQGQGDQPGPGQGQDGPGSGFRFGLQGQDGPGQRNGPPRREEGRTDPLGRPLNRDYGQGDERLDDGARKPVVSGDREQVRTKALQDELRRRGADRTRPQPELDYIDRLLKPF